MTPGEIYTILMEHDVGIRVDGEFEQYSAIKITEAIQSELGGNMGVKLLDYTDKSNEDDSYLFPMALTKARDKLFTHQGCDKRADGFTDPCGNIWPKKKYYIEYLNAVPLDVFKNYNKYVHKIFK